MALLSAKELSLAYGFRPLLAEVSLALEAGDKVALLGRNGEGKSSLLNMLRGKIRPDSGEIHYQNGVKIGFLPQSPPAADARLVREVVAEGVENRLALLAQFSALSAKLASESNPEQLQSLTAQLNKVEAEINACDAWQAEQQIEAILARFELEGDKPMSALSGGWRRRVWLARVLVAQPDILLLDEPTNHLDLASILWLEGVLKAFIGAVVFVSHDRAFVAQIANRFWWLDCAEVLDIRGDYARFLQSKAEKIHAQTLEYEKFDKKLAEEERWIRKGIQARRTRNEGRVRALKQMRKEKAARINAQGKVKLELGSAKRSGKLVVVAENLALYDGDKVLFRGFDEVIERGERIGLLGANGVGKTTLLRVLLGEIAPSEGKVELGTEVKVAYFDQLRAVLDENSTVRDCVAQGSDYVTIAGTKRHIASYLQDFLFLPARFSAPVSALSGGERARLLLARLFASQANVLVLDEPTNDLDVETLELLEEVLAGFEGTVLLVSHDRAFLDGVVTRLWVFNQAKGKIESVIGGVEDWLAQGGKISDLLPQTMVESSAKCGETAQKHAPKHEGEKTKPTASSTKLSYKFQRELEALPAKIEQLEQQIAELSMQIEQPDFYQQALETQQAVFDALSKAQNELDALMARWLALEAGEV